MLALVYHGNEDVRIEERARPMLSHPRDAIVRITLSTICGSDLHLYHGDIPTTRTGDVLGHEAVGIVEEVGPGVVGIAPGQRVAISAVIAEGECWFCQQGLFSLCDRTNINPVQAELYGHHTAGIFGYSHLVGGYDGCQAEYVRVPHADVNLLPLPEDVSDEQAIFLSDILCTGFMAAERSGVGPGVTLALFGCGPVGQMILESARFLGVDRIIALDAVPYRLQVARERYRAIAIDVGEDDPNQALRELTEGRGPDICIDATGFRYARSFRHRLQTKLKLETDATDALAPAIRAVRKGGTVAAIGDFIGLTNQFPIGALMEKGLTLWGSQVQVQHYWGRLLEHVRAGDLDPTFAITHRFALSEAAEAYRLFDEKRDNVLKVMLRPGARAA